MSATWELVYRWTDRVSLYSMRALWVVIMFHMGRGFARWDGNLWTVGWIALEMAMALCALWGELRGVQSRLAHAERMLADSKEYDSRSAVMVTDALIEIERIAIRRRQGKQESRN